MDYQIIELEEKLKENAKVCPREGFSGYKQIIFLLQASAIY